MTTHYKDKEMPVPTVVLMLNPKAQQEVVSAVFPELAKALVFGTEVTFGLEGKKDVACTIMPVLYTLGDADVQVEVRYTAGGDEYGTGVTFDPGPQERKELVTLLHSVLNNFIPSQLSRSVWVIPYYHTAFEFKEKGYNNPNPSGRW